MKKEDAIKQIEKRGFNSAMILYEIKNILWDEYDENNIPQIYVDVAIDSYRGSTSLTI